MRMTVMRVDESQTREKTHILTISRSDNIRYFNIAVTLLLVEHDLVLGPQH